MSLLSDFNHKPILATGEACDELLSCIEMASTMSLSEVKAFFGDDDDEDTGNKLPSENGVGVINVFGGVVTNKVWYERYVNMISYETIVEDFKSYMGDDDVKTVFLNVRSGGGSAHKAFETAKYLRDSANTAGKKIVVYIDSHANSAAYVLASIADEIVINPTAVAGSIGVLIELRNYNKAMEKSGVTRTFITSSDGKIPYDKSGEFRKEFLDNLQADVTKTFQDFIDHIVTYRGMTEQAIRDTNADVFSGQMAVDLGFADKVMTTEAFYDYLATSYGNDEGDTTAAGHSFKNMSSKLAGDVHTASLSDNVLSDTQLGDDMSPEEIALKVQEQVEAKLEEAQAGLLAQLEEAQSLIADKEAKEKESALTSLTTEFKEVSFLADLATDLAEFTMSADESAKALLTSVIGSAKTALTDLAVAKEAELATATAATELAVSEKEQALVDKENAVAKFALSEQSLDGETSLSNPVQGQEVLREKIKKTKALAANGSK